MTQTHITGCILGTAVGDAIGLPYEGLSPRRSVKLLGPPDRHRFLFRRGMVSDDTEHTCMVAQSLIESGGDIDLFRRSLARRFRFRPPGPSPRTARVGPVASQPTLSAGCVISWFSSVVSAVLTMGAAACFRKEGAQQRHEPA